VSTGQAGGRGDPAPHASAKIGARERFELATARIPWTIKRIGVMVAIAAALVGAFSAVGFDTDWMRENWVKILWGGPDLLDGIFLTLIISVSAIALATLLALLGALTRISKSAILYTLSGFYTSFFRGTPLLVQIFLIYFAGAEVGKRLGDAGYESLRNIFTLDAVPAGILALGLNYGAYMTEIFRAGIQSVGHGQREAAEALGMNYRQLMRRVVLPQATRVIIPPTGNEFIAMLKDSALVYTIGVLEMFRLADLAGRRDFRSIEALVLAAAVYWLLTSIFTFFQVRLERRMSKGYVRAVEVGSGVRTTKIVSSSGQGSSGGAWGGDLPLATEVESAEEDPS